MHRGERHREVRAVAGADADGAERAGRRGEIGAGRRQRTAIVAEQTIDEVAGPARGGCILRAAIVLRQRRQHRAPLVFAVGAANAAAAQALEAGRDLLEIGAHLLDLVVHRCALRRLAIEQREEARAFAAHPLGLLRDAIEFALLLGLGFLIAADLFILGGVAGAGATVHRRQLSLEPDAHRIGLRALLLRRRWRRAGVHLREGRRARGGDAEQHGAGQNPAGEGSFTYFQHIRPLRADPHGIKAVCRGKAACCGQGRIQYLLLGAASRRFRGTHVANHPLICRKIAFSARR